jgi:hypothetical protein
MVADVADQQAPVRIERNRMRLPKLCLRRGSAVARESGRASTGERRDDAGLRIDPPNRMVVALGDVEMAGAVELDLVRHVQRRGDGRAAVAVVSRPPAAGDRRRPARVQIEPPDALVAEVAEIQGAIGSDRQAVGIVDLPIGVAGNAGSDQRRDRWRAARDGQCSQRAQRVATMHR